MIHRFGDCELDIGRGELRRGGETVPLEPQVFDLLRLFVERAGDLVSHDDILAAVWKGRVVSDSAVASRINALRRAVGDDGRRQAVLRTVPKRGFRFVAEVDAPRAAGPVNAGQGQHVRMATSRDGSAIAFATTGTGPPLLRAGHFLTHLEDDWRSPVWRPLLDRLGESFSVTRYDQRATGLSDPDPPSLELGRLVDDMEAVADAAGLDRFPIFAASQGVPVSIAFAVRHPRRVSRMVLYGGYAQGRGVRGTGEDAERAEAILRIIRDGWGRSGGAFVTAFTALYMPGAGQEELRSMVDMQLASATPDNAVALRKAIDSFDVSDLLGRVTAPTLVVHARDDAVHPVSQARLLSARIPAAELSVLDSSNHVPLPSDPAWNALLQATEAFLAP